MKLKKTLFYTLLFVSTLGLKAQSINDQLFEHKQFIVENDTLLYRIMLPENFTKEKKYPLVVFLHGAGERGNDNNTQLTHGSALFTSPENRKNFPAIVVFPQCPKTDYWASLTADRTVKPIDFTFNDDAQPTKSLQLVINLLDQLLAASYVNTNKVYVMGLSMGGMGTFELLSRQPTTFAAAVPICGGGNPASTQKYALNTELWVFHGAKDDVVSPQLSIEMVKSNIINGGNPNFTLFGNDNHNSWDSTFAEPNLLPWLFTRIKK